MRIVFALMAFPLAGQLMDGDLRVTVLDPGGRVVAEASVEIEGRSPEFHTMAQTDGSGQARLSRLPLGLYRLVVRKDGFEASSEEVEIRSAVPQTREIRLRVGSVRSEVTVSAAPPLLDPSQPLAIMQAGRDQLNEALGATLGRSVIDVVTTMPGWLLEANAVLHPRGSEYDTQYVVDGMPVYDNRSIGFAPAFENGEFEQVNVLTAGIPAEFGRRLGGVIALDTRRQSVLGHSTEAAFLRGSYDSLSGEFSHGYRAEKTAVSMRANGGWTDRYLDPPSLENFTNRGSAGGLDARLDRDLTPRDRINLYLRSNRTNLLVPNDLEQQEEGQRQDRRASETAGQIHYQHTFSSRAVGTVRGMVRDLSARLWSNPLSTPVYVDQDRGFREGAVIAAATIEGERHTIKFGGDFRTSNIRERFLLAEPDELPDFDLTFQDRRRATEASAFVQDHIRLGNFSANLGLRLDRYSLFVKENAVSPRLAASYYIPKADLLLRASYDRAFQPPAIENLLLSAAAPGLDIDEVEGALAVPASRAHFFEIGVRKPLGNLMRLDVSHYWRRFRNFLDDDVFLNTGLSFPIAFDKANIQGTEVRLDMPRWKRVSSFVSYSNMLGRASSPVTGGLFIQGGEADELRDVTQTFAISQDQRNTVAAQVRVEPHRRVWFSGGVRYGSGLPFESEDDDDDDDDDQAIPQAILDRVNFARGRLKPNFSLNLSAGIRVYERQGRSVTMQIDARNVTDRFNVINFSGLFSGTALGPGRQVSFQLRARF